MNKSERFLFFFTRDKGFYRTFLPMLAVISAQMLASSAVNLADNFMLGAYSELSLSAATIVNQIQFVLQNLIGGLGVGIVVLGSQYWGKGQTGPIKRIISLGLMLSLVGGALFFIGGAVFPRTLISLLTDDEAVIGEAMKYMSLMCWTYLIFSITNALIYSLQSVETAAIGTVMSLSTLCINICLNYILIGGNLGAPEMGIVGAALATLTSRCVELAIILCYIFFIDKKLRIKLPELLRPDFGYMKDFIKVASPLVISGAFWGLGQAAQTAVLGHISAEAIAASSVATIVFSIISVVGMASANASSVTMGKTIGEGKIKMVKPYAITFQAIFLIIGLCAGAGIYLTKDIVVGIYSLSDETRELTVQFLTVLSVTTVGSCFQYPLASGVIAGGGYTKYPAIVENIFTWGLVIPLSFLSAFVFNWSPLMTFICLKCDQILKIIPNVIVCNRFRWVKELTR